ncbi:girdin-like isoform X1 [Varroa destructor]|uniref:HOOK N-terminal domain-containing protein n=1 Tax=Varroa destructor TaxID=109461 RepID=A0A7M7JV42_VARDE|nr:girdin-like isoform X1 [Varroa destructor]XP_022657656.1 girdin-like isoform X1 [Varroa destructor]XP_022657657.1 girdin-like isoform X1 [Varroa destructor]XP_022657658.1 girdin-like isoform X1 [Varroa destructor]XP_022657659.1 girdin-like isoform X1 [Varroa destructor]XP_022657660.1 girdin-like isoform X1 [Varroa destructor]
MSALELEKAFLESPIARWTAQFYSGKSAISLALFCSGEFLYNDIWVQIDSQAKETPVASDDIATRTKTLQRLLEAMLNFYKNHLNQVLVLKLPDVLVLAQYSDSSKTKADAARQAVSELTSLLLLLLGCAVQCDRKEDFITSIKKLDVAEQTVLMESIQQIADNPGAVWPREGNSLDDGAMYAALVDNVRRLTDERDSLAAHCIQLTLDTLSLKERDLHPPPSPVVKENSGLTLELADTKSRLRRLQHEYEEKIELLSEVKEECDQVKENLQRLRQENFQLVQESRCAKALRDEVDILKERCLRYETMESTMQKYKEKISDLEFVRSRCDELKEDLRVTNETKYMLEEQLETSRKKLETVVSQESELISLKVELSEAHLERDLANERLHRLAEEISQLHVDKKNLVEEISRLQLESTHRETDDDEQDSKIAFEGPSLLEQMHNDTLTRCNQLELERERLSCTLQEKERETDKLQGDIVSLNLNVKHLQRKLELAQADCTKLHDVEQQLNAVSLEKTRVQRQAESAEKRLEEAQNDISALTSENSRLTASLTTMKGTMQRVNQLEKEKNELESRIKSLEDERRASDRELQRARQNLEERERDVDTLSEKFTHAEKELATVRENLVTFSGLQEQLAANEVELHTIKEELSIEKAALVDLRQEMIHEKVKNGLLENELEQVHIQLDNMEKLQQQQQNNTLDVTKGSTTDEYLSTASSVTSGTLDANGGGSTTLSSPSVFEPGEEDERIDTEILLGSAIPVLNGDAERSSTESADPAVTIIGSLRAGRESSSSGPFSLPAPGAELQSGTRESPAGATNTTASSRVADLKDKIVQLEHKKLQSEAECMAAKKQLSVVKQQLLNAEYEIAQEVAKREALAKQNAALQSHFARLEVDQSVAISAKLQLQEQTEVLKQELGEVKAKLREKELEIMRTTESQEKVTNDYKVLDALHKQLGQEFETVKNSLAANKNVQKIQKNENAELQRLVNKLRDQLETLREELREKEELASSVELLQSIPGGATLTTSELLQDNERLKEDLNALQNTYRQLKDDNNQKSLRITELQGQLQSSQHDRSSRDVEISRLTASYQMQQHVNQVLEEERKSLLVKVTSLMASYDQHFRRLLDVISTCDNSQGAEEIPHNNSYEQERLRMEEERRLLEDKLSEYTSKLDKRMCISQAISSRSSTPLPVEGSIMGSEPGGLMNRTLTTPSPLTVSAQLTHQTQAPVHVNRTVENHTTINVVNQVHHYPAQPLTSTPVTTGTSNSGLSRSPAARHSMYARGSHGLYDSANHNRQYLNQQQFNASNGSSSHHHHPALPQNQHQSSSHHGGHGIAVGSSATGPTGLFRTTLRKEAAAAGLGSGGSLSDVETPSRRSALSVTSSGIASPAPQTTSASNTPTKQDVWYEYGCV